MAERNLPAGHYEKGNQPLSVNQRVAFWNRMIQETKPPTIEAWIQLHYCIDKLPYAQPDVKREPTKFSIAELIGQAEPGQEVVTGQEAA